MPAVETTAQDLTELLQALLDVATTRKTVWGTPIPHNATPVDAEGFAVAPAYGAANQVIVASYQLKRGYSCLICGLVLGYAGGGGSALPGQVLYRVDVDSPTAVPIPGVGYAEKDYASVGMQRGSLVPGDPWPVAFQHNDQELIQIKAQTVASVPVGAGNFVFGALLGWQWPTMGWEQ